MTLQLYNFATLQLHSFATLQLCNFATLQIYNFATLQLYSFAILQLYSFATLQLCNFITLHLYNFRTLQPCNFATLQLCNFTTLQLYNFIILYFIFYISYFYIFFFWWIQNFRSCSDKIVSPTTEKKRSTRGTLVKRRTQRQPSPEDTGLSVIRLSSAFLQFGRSPFHLLHPRRIYFPLSWQLRLIPATSFDVYRRVLFSLLPCHWHFHDF